MRGTRSAQLPQPRYHRELVKQRRPIPKARDDRSDQSDTANVPPVGHNIGHYNRASERVADQGWLFELKRLSKVIKDARKERKTIGHSWFVRLSKARQINRVRGEPTA